MTSINDLRPIKIFQDLDDTQLEKILPLVQEAEFNENETIYKKDQPAQNLYLIKKGKVILEDDISIDISVSLSAMKAGYVFGWYALLTEGTYSYNAVCAEPSTIFIIPRDKFLALLEENPDIGYKVMIRMFEIIKLRLDRRTVQFVSLLSLHPDMRELVADTNIPTDE